MAKNRPSFRVMRNGYDRFAVDSAIDNYTSQIEELEKEIAELENLLNGGSKRKALGVIPMDW